MPEVIRLAVTGADGRMGRAVIARIADDTRFALAAAHARNDELDAAVRAADVVIDFTRPEFTLEVIDCCVAHGRALVSGTTGMDDAGHAALAAAAQKIPVFWAPNMSVGVNLLLTALAAVAARIGDDYDAEIIEAHHRHKVDAPSGTAIALGEVLAAARGRPLAEIGDYGRAGRSAPRERGRIGFHSLRAGEIVGEHDVRLIAAGEEIRLGHSAFGREAFASGALRAAAWLQGRKPGLYGMRELLELPAR